MTVVLTMITFGRPLVKSGLGIPVEFVLEDERVSRATAEVLDKWRRDFSSLLNGQSNSDFQSSDLSFRKYTGPSVPPFDAHISVLEVKKTIGAAKKGNACEIHAIPVEELCNVTSFSFLHVLFSVCFDKRNRSICIM